MRLLKKMSPELLVILDEYKKWFDQAVNFGHGRLILPVDEKRIDGHTLASATSTEYLESVMKDSHRGIPEVALVTDFQYTPLVPVRFRNKSAELCDELLEFLGAKFNAVHVHYPSGGFMGWHSNWDCPGYNILMSHSPDGKGFFRYRDSVTKEIITMKDTIGWSCKVGYYGGKEESEDLHYWHCAGSDSPRQTLGFVIPHKEMWEMMIEEIEG